MLWYEGTATSDKRYITFDNQGSVIGYTDASGNTKLDAGGGKMINAYDEYGVPKAGNQGRFAYTGQTWLPEVGLYYYKARLYSPTLGRFMQTDPIGYKDGMNWYAYVGDDPVDRSDSSGLYYCATGGNGTKCQEAIKNYYNELIRSRDSFKKGSPEYVRINDAVIYLGAPGKDGDRGRVDITIGKTTTGGLAEAGGTGSITVDLKALKKYDLAFGASAIGHETQHLINEYNRPNNYRPNYSEEHEYKDEESAYTTQSIILQGLKDSSTEFYNPGMTSGERESQIKQGAKGSTKLWCNAMKQEFGKAPGGC